MFVIKGLRHGTRAGNRALRACLLPVLGERGVRRLRLRVVPGRRHLRGAGVLRSKRALPLLRVRRALSQGILAKIKPRAFTEFARRFGEGRLLDCLERNEAAGVSYHREGVVGDYDDIDDLEELIAFIETGQQTKGRAGRAHKRGDSPEHQVSARKRETFAQNATPSPSSVQGYRSREELRCRDA